MKVLVVGAAGYLGRHVWRELEERGHEVVAVDGLFWGQPAPPGLIEARVQAYRDYDKLMREHNPDSTVWLGAIAHDPLRRVPLNTQAAYTWAAPVDCLGWDTAQRPRAVFVSSLSVFNKPGKPWGYPDYKREAERQLFGRRSTTCSILRFGTLFGPGVDTDSYREHLLLNKMVYDGRKHGVVRVANPKARRPVYPVSRAAEDVVEAAVSDYPPGVENHFTFSRSILEYGEAVSTYLKVPLSVEEGADSRDYGWDDGHLRLGMFFLTDVANLADWTREHLEEIRPRRQIFERADA